MKTKLYQDIENTILKYFGDSKLQTSEMIGLFLKYFSKIEKAHKRNPKTPLYKIVERVVNK